MWGAGIIALGLVLGFTEMDSVSPNPETRLSERDILFVWRYMSVFRTRYFVCVFQNATFCLCGAE